MVLLRFVRDEAALFIDDQLLAVIPCPNEGADRSDLMDSQVELELRRLGVYEQLLSWLESECARIRGERRLWRSPTLGIFTG